MTINVSRSNHRVRKLSCDTVYKSFDKNDSFSSLKAEMDSFVKSALPELLDDVFSQYDSIDQVYYLKQLHLNFPLTYMGDKIALQKQLLYECETQLARVLGNLIKSKENSEVKSRKIAKTSPDVKSERLHTKLEAENEAVLFYLQFGFLNWKHQPYKQSLSRILERSLPNSTLLKSIKKLIVSDQKVILRLTKIMDKQADVRIYSWVFPEQTNALVAFWQDMGNKLQEDLNHYQQIQRINSNVELVAMFVAIDPQTNINVAFKQVILSIYFSCEKNRITNTQILSRLIGKLAKVLSIEKSQIWLWMNYRFVFPLQEKISQNLQKSLPNGSSATEPLLNSDGVHRNMVPIDKLAIDKQPIAGSRLVAGKNKVIESSLEIVSSNDKFLINAKQTSTNILENNGASQLDNKVTQVYEASEADIDNKIASASKVELSKNDTAIKVSRSDKGEVLGRTKVEQPSFPALFNEKVAEHVSVITGTTYSPKSHTKKTTEETRSKNRATSLLRDLSVFLSEKINRHIVDEVNYSLKSIAIHHSTISSHIFDEKVNGNGLQFESTSSTLISDSIRRVLYGSKESLTKFEKDLLVFFKSIKNGFPLFSSSIVMKLHMSEDYAALRKDTDSKNKLNPQENLVRYQQYKSRSTQQEHPVSSNKSQERQSLDGESLKGHFLEKEMSNETGESEGLESEGPVTGEIKQRFYFSEYNISPARNVEDFPFSEQVESPTERESFTNSSKSADKDGEVFDFVTTNEVVVKTTMDASKINDSEFNSLLANEGFTDDNLYLFEALSYSENVQRNFKRESVSTDNRNANKSLFSETEATNSQPEINQANENFTLNRRQEGKLVNPFSGTGLAVDSGEFAAKTAKYNKNEDKVYESNLYENIANGKGLKVDRLTKDTVKLDEINLQLTVSADQPLSTDVTESLREYGVSPNTEKQILTKSDESFIATNDSDHPSISSNYRRLINSQVDLVSRELVNSQVEKIIDIKDSASVKLSDSLNVELNPSIENEAAVAKNKAEIESNTLALSQEMDLLTSLDTNANIRPNDKVSKVVVNNSYDLLIVKIEISQTGANSLSDLVLNNEVQEFRNVDSANHTLELKFNNSKMRSKHSLSERPVKALSQNVTLEQTALLKAQADELLSNNVFMVSDSSSAFRIGVDLTNASAGSSRELSATDFNWQQLGELYLDDKVRNSDNSHLELFDKKLSHSESSVLNSSNKNLVGGKLDLEYIGIKESSNEEPVFRESDIDMTRLKTLNHSELMKETINNTDVANAGTNVQHLNTQEARNYETSQTKKFSENMDSSELQGESLNHKKSCLLDNSSYSNEKQSNFEQNSVLINDDLIVNETKIVANEPFESEIRIANTETLDNSYKSVNQTETKHEKVNWEQVNLADEPDRLRNSCESDTLSLETEVQADQQHTSRENAIQKDSDALVEETNIESYEITTTSIKLDDLGGASELELFSQTQSVYELHVKKDISTEGFVGANNDNRMFETQAATESELIARPKLTSRAELPTMRTPNTGSEVLENGLTEVPSSIVQQIKDEVSLIDNARDAYANDYSRESLMDEIKSNSKIRTSNIDNTSGEDWMSSKGKRGIKDLAETTFSDKSAAKLSSSYKSVKDIIGFFDDWMSMPEALINQQLLELLDSRQKIKRLSANLTTEQFVMLLKIIRKQDYNQLISFASVVVDLLADANNKRKIQLPNSAEPSGRLSTSDENQRRLLLHYLILSFWVLPQQKFVSPVCVFAACQFLSNEMEMLLEFKNISEPNVESQNTRINRVDSITNNRNKSKTEPEHQVSKRIEVEQHEKVENETLADAFKKQHSINQIQQRIWQQRLLGALAVWSSRSEFSSSTGLRNSSKLTISDSTGNNKNLPFRLLSEFIQDDKSILQMLKQTCLTDNPVSNQRLSDISGIRTLESNRSKIGESLHTKSNEQINWAMNEPFLVENSGLVLLSPYFERIFQAFSWIDNGKFIDDNCAEKAVMLLNYLGTGQRQADEIDLGLCKVLCGLPLESFIRTDLSLEEDIYSTADSLLNAVISHWRALGSTSVDGLRGSFLLRNGWLQQEPERWLLNVENKAFDMLLDQLPWSFRLIKHGWMPLPLSTEWRNNS